MRNIYIQNYFLENELKKEQTNQLNQPGAEVQNLSGDLSHPNFKGNELPDFGKEIVDNAKKKDVVEASMISWIKH